MNEIFLVGGLLFLGIGLSMLYRQIQALRWGGRSMRWPTTLGTIQSAGIQRYTGGEDAFYRVKVGYTYTVAGIPYHAQRLAFGIQPYIWWHAAAREAVAKYPSGSIVTVHYNPDNPKVAVLMTGVSADSRLLGWFSSLVPVALGALSIGIYFIQA
jgi:hypothetical protein